MEDFSVHKFYRSQLFEQEDQLEPEDDSADSAFTKEPKDKGDEGDPINTEKVAQLLPEFEETMAGLIEKAFNKDVEIEHINEKAFLSKLKNILNDDKEIAALLSDGDVKDTISDVLIFSADAYFKEIIDQQNLTNTNSLSASIYELYRLFKPYFYDGTVDRHLTGYIKNFKS